MQLSVKYMQRLRSMLGSPCVIDISSKLPKEIFQALDKCTINTDSVLITNGDVWRYSNIEQNIFNPPALVGKKVYFQTLGYTNAQLNDNHYYLSFPYLFVLRDYNNKPFEPLAKNLDYGFACLNNNCAIHRFKIGHEFFKNSLLGNILFSQNLQDEDLSRIEQDRNMLGLDRFYEYKSQLPIILPEEQTGQPVDFRFFKGKDSWTIPFDLSAYCNAYCFISIETEVEDYPYEQNINLPIATEKSLKSFQTRQLPFIVGARGHYAFLKGLGFEMMEDLLPNGYDEMPFLQKVGAVVDTVAKGEDFVKDFYFDHIREIKHNYELVNSTKVDDLILSRIKDMIN